MYFPRIAGPIDLFSINQSSIRYTDIDRAFIQSRDFETPEIRLVIAAIFENSTRYGSHLLRLKDIAKLTQLPYGVASSAFYKAIREEYLIRIQQSAPDGTAAPNFLMIPMEVSIFYLSLMRCCTSCGRLLEEQYYRSSDSKVCLPCERQQGTCSPREAFYVLNELETWHKHLIHDSWFDTKRKSWFDLEGA